MSNIDVEQLRRSVLHIEYETAQEIRHACIDRGFSVTNGFAVVYRAGVNAGRQAQKDNLHKVYSLSGTTVIMTNRLELPVSKTFAEHLNAEFAKHMF